MSETWKDIPGYAYRYQVSDLGRVKTFSRWLEGRVMKTYFTADSHREAVKLRKVGGGWRHRQISVLVAEAFLGPRPAGMEVCHGPGGSSDNRLENLSYASHAVNCFDKYRDGTMYNITPVRRSDGAVFVSIAEAVRNTPGAHHANICRVLAGKRLTCAGYHWRYVNA